MNDKMLTVEEAIKMQGVEFTYVFEDGDEIQAYVKKFDPEIGLTCMSLEAETRDGWEEQNENRKEEDGTFCVVSIKIDNYYDLTKALHFLTKIRDNKSFTDIRFEIGNPSCAFM